MIITARIVKPDMKLDFAEFNIIEEFNRFGRQLMAPSCFQQVGKRLLSIGYYTSRGFHVFVGPSETRLTIKSMNVSMSVITGLFHGG